MCAYLVAYLNPLTYFYIVKLKFIKMETPQTHWKKLHNPNYIGAYSLNPGEDLTVQIVQVKKEMVSGSDGKQDECTVAHLKNQKPFILNVTNCKTIAKVHDSHYIEDWVGKRITLYVAKIRAFGEWVEALRVREEVPTLPELTPDHKAWDKALKSVQEGKVTIEQIKSKYTLSEDNATKLQTPTA